MIRKHFTGARIPRRRNAYVGKPSQNNLSICLLTRGCTCVCKKHTGWRRRTHIRIKQVLMHWMREIALLPMGFDASQASRGDARRTRPTLQIKPARAIQIAPDGLLNRLFARAAGKAVTTRDPCSLPTRQPPGRAAGRQRRSRRTRRRLRGTARGTGRSPRTRAGRPHTRRPACERHPGGSPRPRRS